MQYLFINEQNMMEVRTSEIPSGNNLLSQLETRSIGELLELEQKTVFTYPKWYPNHIRIVRERASAMLKRGVPVKEVNEFIQAESQKVKARRRGYFESFCVERIPPQFTGGKHLSIAFQQKKWCPPQYGNCLSPIISVCLHQSLKGRRENKDGRKLDTGFYGYKGRAIIFDDWTVAKDKDWKGREYPFSFCLGKDEQYKKSKPTFMSEREFHMIYQSTQNFFHTQHQLQQLKERQRVEEKKKLFALILQEKEVEDDYKQMLNKASTVEYFHLIKKKILGWQEEEKQIQRKPIEEEWWYNCPKEGYSWKKEGEKDGEKDREKVEKKKEKEGEKYVINPETNRKIKVGGETYCKLVQKGIFSD